MSIESEARAAHRRMPEEFWQEMSGEQYFEEGFRQGAVWAHEQADHVERIARVLAQASTFTGQDALLLVKTAQKIAEAEAIDRMGPAAGCAYCVGAGGYEDYDGEWRDCSCQLDTPSGTP